MSTRERISYEFDSFLLDAGERLLLREGEPVALAPKVFDTLLALVENSGRLIDRDELMSTLWPDTFVGDATLARYISDLRKVLGETSDQKYIETIPKAGYRFVAGVRQVTGDPTVVIRRRTRSRVLVEEESADDHSIRSIAVLPFRQLGGLNLEEYLGLGMADALIARLSNLPQIVVRPTSAVLKYSEWRQQPVLAAQELAVDAVLEGTIRQSNDRIRITVQLVTARDNAALWAERFDEKMTDIFTVEDSISEQVAVALTLKLTDFEKRLLTRRHTEDVRAYQLYLKGRYLWYKRTEQALRKSIEQFEAAIDIDPGYALAWDGISDSYALLALRGMIKPGRALRKARATAQRALEIDDNLGEAHASLAHVRLHDWDWTGLEEEFQRALKLSPGHAIAYHWYSEYLMAVGRSDEAIEVVRRAEKVDPLSPVIRVTLAAAFYFAGHYDQALEQIREGLEINPNHFQLHLKLGLTLIAQGKSDEAIEAMQNAVTLSRRSTETLAGLAQAYAASGMRAEMQSVLDELNNLSKDQYVSPYYIAKIWASFGDKTETVEWLEKAYEERNPDLIELKVEPALVGIRTDRRYQELVRRVGLDS